jgi:hypothetical protein
MGGRFLNQFLEKEREMIDVESILFWVGVSAGCNGFRKNKEGQYELYWYVYDEAMQYYEGHKDPNCPLYTTKELMQKYEIISKNLKNEDKIG